MGRISSSTSGCSIQQTLDVIGDRWMLLIIRNLFRGARRFSELEEDLGIAKNLLTARLNKLVSAEIVERGSLSRSTSSTRIPLHKKVGTCHPV